MKKLLYFIPTLLIAIFFLFLLFILSGHTNLSDAYITAIGILSIFGVSDWLLYQQKWFGFLPAALFGAYIIYYGSQYHGQVFDERPIGAVICLYYLICGIVTYKKANPHI